MATKRQHVRHIFSGGFAPDFGPTTETPVDQFGRVMIPFLTKAENVFFELDGGPHKIGGTTKLNSSVVESGAVITGLFDYWRTGTAGSPVQKRIIHAGTKILKDDADGIFDDLFTGLSSGAVPSYNTFDDILIIASDSSDVPRSWDQTTAQNLAGTPPNFSFSETHQNRVWAAGVNSFPSRLFFSEFVDPEDWTGAGSGFIDIDPDDGDEIRAIASHKNELWVFKGPHKGSIHRITGTAPTGGDTFARKTFVRGLGAVNHNGIFRFKDDLGFIWSDGTIHSLAATASFGDFNEAALSRDINKYIEENINFSQLKKVWAVNSVKKGTVLFGVPIGGSTDNNIVLMMDYRFNPVRWAIWPALTPTALAVVIDQSNSDQLTIMIGSDDGFVRKTDVPSRSIDGVTAINFVVTTPFIHYGAPIIKKTIAAATVGINPRGDFDLTFGWQRDSDTQRTKTISQGGGDVLAAASANQFTLGTSTLSGGQFIDRFIDLDEGGEFRSIQYEISNSVLNEDLELHSISSIIESGSWSTEN